jgi:hypothetical protein
MENLVIKHKTFSVVRKIIGVIMFLNGLFWFLAHLDNMNFADWFFGISFTILGGAYFFSAFGSEQSTVNIGEGLIKVRWMNWVWPVIIPDIEIEKIILTRFHIIIERKVKKQVKMPIDFFETDQKKEVYSFFIELARQKNIQLDRTGINE